MLFLETLLAKEGCFPYLDWHQRRLDRTAAAHGFNAYDLQAVLKAPVKGVWRCRVLYGASDIRVEYLPYRPREVHRLALIEDSTIEYRYKYADRAQLVRLFDQRGDADDVLIVREGLVTDTTIANVAFFDGVHWVTPQAPLLEGTARARLIAQGFLHPHRVTLDAALRAEKVAVMNALSGFVEVSGGILLPKDSKAKPC